MFGVASLLDGQRRRRLTAALNGLLPLFEGRVLPFDTEAARHYADLAVKARTAGRGFPCWTGTSPQLQSRAASSSPPAIEVPSMLLTLP